MNRVLVVVFSLLTFFSKAQNQSSAVDYIVKLKSGAAVVRLYMNKPKINAYTKVLDNPSVSQSEKAEIKKALEDHLEDRNKYKLRMIRTIDSLFTFTRVYYMYDYDQRRLQNGEKSGFFLNRNGEIDPSITIKEDNYLLFGRGSSDEKIIIYQPNGEAMPAGFPDRHNPNIFESMKNIFSSGSRLAKEITRINKKLIDYYSEYGE